MYAVFVGFDFTHTHIMSKILLVEKILILFFKLRQAKRFRIESYQKNTNMNILCVGQKKLVSSLSNQTL